LLVACCCCCCCCCCQHYQLPIANCCWLLVAGVGKLAVVRSSTGYVRSVINQWDRGGLINRFNGAGVAVAGVYLAYDYYRLSAIYARDPRATSHERPCRVPCAHHVVCAGSPLYNATSVYKLNWWKCNFSSSASLFATCRQLRKGHRFHLGSCTYITAAHTTLPLTTCSNNTMCQHLNRYASATCNAWRCLIQPA
jgi:hypothetical protein